jgi:choline dehydrogenase-like flavoprotein
MIIDAAALNPASPPAPYDVVVVGSGPAGLTVANELRGRGLRLCVLESGQTKKTAHADALKRVVTQGDIVVGDRACERVLGGTSSTWDGLSAPLDPIDLEPRGWVPLSGWPIARDELRGWYARAAAGYGFAHPDLYASAHVQALKAGGDRDLRWRRLTERLFLAPTRPQRFATLLRPVLESPELDVYTDATVVALSSNRSRSAVDACDLRTRAGTTLRIRGSVIVVAAGGIENARLFLNSTDFGEAGLGNGHDQVGRYFMNHPRNPAGTVTLAVELRHLPAYFGCLYRGRAAYLALRLDDATQAELQVLNSYVRGRMSRACSC